MNKVKNLQEKMRIFRSLLKEHEKDNVDAELLLKWLTPLFNDIEQGIVTPPQRFEHRNALGKEAPFYEPNSMFLEPYSDFVAALEDWPSQSWYKALNHESKS